MFNIEKKNYLSKHSYSVEGSPNDLSDVVSNSNLAILGVGSIILQTSLRTFFVLAWLNRTVVTQILNTDVVSSPTCSCGVTRFVSVVLVFLLNIWETYSNWLKARNFLFWYKRET